MVLPTRVSPSPEIAPETIESVLLDGDLAKLTPAQRIQYYQKVCHSLGLNPLTKPLEYIKLNGKLTLYAKRDCADQLRAIHGVSVKIVSQEISDGVITIHAQASLPDGRTDEDLGVVPCLDTFKGEALANAKKKAITQAKRRVTLSICGLGFLDETEISSVPSAEIPAIEDGEVISIEQLEILNKLIEESVGYERFLATMKIENVDDLPARDFEKVRKSLETKKKEKAAAEA